MKHSPFTGLALAGAAMAMTTVVDFARDIRPDPPKPKPSKAKLKARAKGKAQRAARKRNRH